MASGPLMTTSMKVMTTYPAQIVCVNACVSQCVRARVSAPSRRVYVLGWLAGCQNHRHPMLSLPQETHPVTAGVTSCNED